MRSPTLGNNRMSISATTWPISSSHLPQEISAPAPTEIIVVFYSYLFVFINESVSTPAQTYS